jgi:hypothetical protein
MEATSLAAIESRGTTAATIGSKHGHAAAAAMGVATVLQWRQSGVRTGMHRRRGLAIVVSGLIAGLGCVVSGCPEVEATPRAKSKIINSAALKSKLHLEQSRVVLCMWLNVCLLQVLDGKNLSGIIIDESICF